jgi:8-amino-7-oxononanoate synthase
MLAERIQSRLRQLESRCQTRRLRLPAGIDLTSNDYLGLAQHPRVTQRMADAVLSEGAGSTGSRLLRGERESFARIEHKFARFKQTERSLFFSSGYLANIAVIATFPEAGDVIFSDERNHASLIDGMRLSKARRVIFPHNNVTALRSSLQTEVSGQKFLVVESLFSMDGDEAPLGEYAELCRETNTALIVDEAHAVGIYGETGSGFIEEAGIAQDVFISINPAGKALGAGGAFVAAAADTIEYLIQRARTFIFSTAATPAMAAALEASLEVIAAEPERRHRLLDRARYLRDKLAMPGRSQIVPLMIGENKKAIALAERLQAQGFDVRAIRPPTVPDGTARLRISVREGLTEAVLDEFCAALREL